jgi:polysaccharide transporter, PST family
MAQPRRYSIVGGTLVTVAMRWCDRLVGVISTIILARLLLPEDFGIIAMASVAIALADVLLDFGVNVALIRNPDVTQAHYDTAWTIRLIQASIATTAVVLAAPLAGELFNDGRVTPVLHVLAFSLLLAATENIGIIAFQKNLEFGAEFRFLVIRRIAGFFIAILLAWLLRSYWALVIGALIGRAFGVWLSYVLHPMRPRLSLAKFQDVFAVSQWMLIRGVGTYVQGNLHKILVGRWSSATVMGAYTLADEISAIPTVELLAPLNRVLFPAFAKVQHNLQELKRLLLLAQGVQTLVAIPAGIGLALVADDAVRLLLGEKWLVAVPFVQILALGSVAQSLTTSGGYVMLVLGKIRFLAFITWTQVSLFVALASFLPEQPLAIAWLRLGLGVTGILLTFAMLMRVLPILKLHEVFRASVRPLAAACAMAAVIMLLSFSIDFPLAIKLAVKVSLGVLIYACAVLGIWWLAGRPSGPESYLLNNLGELLSRAKKPQGGKL